MTGLDDVTHDDRVQYGRRLEQAAELLHEAVRAFDIRADVAAPPHWAGLSDVERNQLRAGLDQLARAELATLEDLTYLARRVRDRDY